jgi:hypothetical protein
VARELREVILPRIDDATVRVSVEMLEQVVRSCAVRAAHELAWMAEEEAAILTFARRLPASAGLARALAAHAEHVADHGEGLHLDDCVARYRSASVVLSEAIEAAFASADPGLVAEARAIVLARNAHEIEARPGFYFPGRA